MRTLVAPIAGLVAAAAFAAPLQAQPARGAPSRAPHVSLLDVDEHPTNFDRPVFFRLAVDRDANVAVFHVSPTGRLRVIHPASANDRQRVRRGDTLELSVGGFREGWLERQAGYAGWAGYSGGLDRLPFVFAIASEKPIDLSRFGRTGTWRYQFVVDRADGADRVIDEVVAATLRGATDDEYTVDAFDYGYYQRQRVQHAYSALAACGAPASTLLALQGFYPWDATSFALGTRFVFVPHVYSGWAGLGYHGLGFDPAFAYGFPGRLAAQCGSTGTWVAFADNAVGGMPVGPGGAPDDTTKPRRLGGPKDSVAARKTAGLDGGPKNPDAPLGRAKLAVAEPVLKGGEGLASPEKSAKPATKWQREETVERKALRNVPEWAGGTTAGRQARGFEVEPFRGGSDGGFGGGGKTRGLDGGPSATPAPAPAPAPRPLEVSKPDVGSKKIEKP